MEMLYLAGALSTALVVAFSPKLSLPALHKEMPETMAWSERKKVWDGVRCPSDRFAGMAFVLVAQALPLAMPLPNPQRIGETDGRICDRGAGA